MVGNDNLTTKMIPFKQGHACVGSSPHRTLHELYYFVKLAFPYYWMIELNLLKVEL